MASAAALDDGARLLGGQAGRQVLAAAVRAAGAELGATRIRSVHHRAGRSLSYVYEATIEAGEAATEALLVAHLDRRPFPEGTYTVRHEGVEVAVWRFPHDPYLPGLPSAVSRRRVRELLDRLGAEAGAVRLRTRAYRPSRRAVVEVRLESGERQGRLLYLKVLSGGRAAELADVHRQLAAAGVPVPRVIGVAAAQGIVAMAALRGATLREALLGGAGLPAPAELVALTRRVAGSGLTSSRDPRAFADPRRHVALLQRLVPEDAATVARVARAVAGLDGSLAPVHGDLHDGQLLVVEGTVTGVLDVDGAGAGLVAEDAGNLVAHLEVLAQVVPQAARIAAGYADEVARAFRQEVGARTLARATAGAWLTLATGPYRAQDEDWHQATRARISRAAAVLDGG